MNVDSSLILLYKYIAEQCGPALWLLDEHGGNACFPEANSNVRVVSNRYDVVCRLQQEGWRAEFSDYDFSAMPMASLDKVFFRLAKEKPLVHYVINSAAQLLKKGGRLLLAGTKQQGIKTYAKSAARCLGGRANIEKRGNEYLVEVIRGDGKPEALDDKNYKQLREIMTLNMKPVSSKPGLYGWAKVDAGSQLFVEQFSSFACCKPPDTILDLGCGYGYLSLMAHDYFPGAHITASDNNAAALRACKDNFNTHGIVGDVIADDCGGGLRGDFELIICNPPFHQGFGVERDLSRLFIERARDLCHTKGQVGFVVNAFIPIEKIAREYFSNVEQLSGNGQFKVLCMRP